MAFAPCPFADRKQKRTECCSLRDIFSSNGAAFNGYKWRHSDIVYIKSSVYSWLNSIPSMYFRFFTFWKLTQWCRFVTCLWNDWAFASILIKLHLFVNVMPDGFLCSSYLIFWRKPGHLEAASRPSSSYVFLVFTYINHHSDHFRICGFCRK